MTRPSPSSAIDPATQQCFLVEAGAQRWGFIISEFTFSDTTTFSITTQPIFVTLSVFLHTCPPFHDFYSLTLFIACKSFPSYHHMSPSTPLDNPHSSMSLPSLWYLRTHSLKAKDCRNLVLSIYHALEQVKHEISQELVMVKSSEIMAVVVTYARWCCVFFPSLTFYSSPFHPSTTEFEYHFTSRIFASTPNGGSIYLSGLHTFSPNSSSVAKFQPCCCDGKRSPWRRRTFANTQCHLKLRELKAPSV